jgi:hypothetical protein
MDKDLNGARVYYWTADSQQKFGTVVENSTEWKEVASSTGVHGTTTHTHTMKFQGIRFVKVKPDQGEAITLP